MSSKAVKSTSEPNTKKKRESQQILKEKRRSSAPITFTTTARQRKSGNDSILWNNSDEEKDEEGLIASISEPPSYRFFGVKIKGHPDNPPEERETGRQEEFGIDEDNILGQPTELVFEEGRVARLEVDPEFIKILDKDKKDSEFAQCCVEQHFEISPKLGDLKTQGIFIFKILSLENMLHLIPLAFLAIQYYVISIHGFFYEQWIILLLIIFVIYVTIIWGVVFQDLANTYPADNLLLALKAFGTVVVSILITSTLEHVIVVWVHISEDHASSDSLSNAYKARGSVDKQYTYPLIVPIFLVNVSTSTQLLSIFFYTKGNIKSDKMLWLCLFIHILLFSTQFAVYVTNVLKNKLFLGPPEWDATQIILSNITATTWSLWRLYHLREVLAGKRFPLEESSFKKVAISFSV